MIMFFFFTHQMGAYHTIELELNRKFTLAKKSWDSVVLDRIGKQKISLCLILVFGSFKLPLARQPGLADGKQWTHKYLVYPTEFQGL